MRMRLCISLFLRRNDRDFRSGESDSPVERTEREEEKVIMVKKKKCKICNKNSIVVNWDICGFDAAHQRKRFEIRCMNEKCLAAATGKTMIECWDNYKKLIEDVERFRKERSGENGERK